MLELLTLTLMIAMLIRMQSVGLYHLMQAVIVIELMQLKVVGHFLHQQWIVGLHNGRLMLWLLLLLVLLLLCGLVHLNWDMLWGRDRCHRR